MNENEMMGFKGRDRIISYWDNLHNAIERFADVPRMKHYLCSYSLASNELVPSSQSAINGSMTYAAGSGGGISCSITKFHSRNGDSPYHKLSRRWSNKRWTKYSVT